MYTSNFRLLGLFGCLHLLHMIMGEWYVLGAGYAVIQELAPTVLASLATATTLQEHCLRWMLVQSFSFAADDPRQSQVFVFEIASYRLKWSSNDVFWSLNSYTQLGPNVMSLQSSMDIRCLGNTSQGHLSSWGPFCSIQQCFLDFESIFLYFSQRRLSSTASSISTLCNHATIFCWTNIHHCRSYFPERESGHTSPLVGLEMKRVNFESGCCIGLCFLPVLHFQVCHCFI